MKPRPAVETVARQQKGRGQFAFTMVELLVVVAIIAILASLLLPSLTKTKSKAHGLYCLNNTKQLTLGWLLYADDHDGKLCPNRLDSSESWVRGVLDFNNTNPDNTNALYLVDAKYAKLAPYISIAGSFKCPADRSSVNYLRQSYPRVRSFAMNHAVGAAEQSGQLRFASGWMVYRKASDIVNPSPCGLWLLMDEHPDSIDDGRFVIDCDSRGPSARLISFPAALHGGSASISFADGHSEAHKWLDETTKYPVKYCGCLSHYAASSLFTAATNSPDIAWLQERTSSKLR